MSTAPGHAFTGVLRTCREEINARFAVMRREFADLEAEAYFHFLRGSGDAVVSAVAATVPGAIAETGQAVCETGMELVARNLAGPKAPARWLDEAWVRVLVPAARLVSAGPRRVIAAVSNAVHQLASTHGARPAQWISLMEKVAALTDNADVFLRAGQVAGWRCGLAHFREGALQLASALPAEITNAALDADGGDPAVLLERLRRDPWFDPSAPSNRARLVARAGTFRGFGGHFAAPPVVSLLNGQWLAGSGGEHWLLMADAFGATFHRVVGQEMAPPPPPDRAAVAALRVPADCGEVTSLAANGATTAVTASLTHAVLFFHTQT